MAVVFSRGFCGAAGHVRVALPCDVLIEPLFITDSCSPAVKLGGVAAACKRAPPFVLPCFCEASWVTGSAQAVLDSADQASYPLSVGLVPKLPSPFSAAVERTTTTV